MSTYRYLFADLLTNQVIAELPCTGVNFTQALNSAGTFSGSLLLSGLQTTANATNGTVPGRTALYVDRDGVLVWGGIIWHRQYDSADQHLKLQAREFESYFERRRITTSQNFTAVDQLTIAQTLVNQAQAATNGNIGVIVPTNTSGVTVNKTYYSYELKTVYQALLDLSRSTNGFDFAIKVAYDGGGTPTKTLYTSYPQSGVRYSATDPGAPMFELPAGNIVQYAYPEDATIAANIIYAVGAGSNEGKLISASTSTAQLAAGWPLLEDSANFSDITDSTLLANLSAGQLAAVSYPPTTLQIVSPPGQDPVLGSYTIGDDARVRIIDERFPNGIDTTYRITALNVTPGENNQPERVTITLTLPTS